VSLGGSGPGVRSRFLETPCTPWGGVFLGSTQTASQSAVSGASTPRVRRRSEAVDVDRGQLLGRSLEDVAVIVDLHELAPVSGQATGGSDGRRCCDTRAKPSWPSPACEPPVRSKPAPAGRLRRLRDEGDQSDVATTVGALEWKLLSHPRHELGPRNPGGVVRTGFLIRVAAASRAVTVAPMPAGRGGGPLANVPFSPAT
jgi:hypothetical protein